MTTPALFDLDPNLRRPAFVALRAAGLAGDQHGDDAHRKQTEAHPAQPRRCIRRFVANVRELGKRILGSHAAKLAREPWPVQLLRKRLSSFRLQRPGGRTRMSGSVEAGRGHPENSLYFPGKVSLAPKLQYLRAKRFGARFGAEEDL